MANGYLAQRALKKARTRQKQKKDAWMQAAHRLWLGAKRRGYAPIVGFESYKISSSRTLSRATSRCPFRSYWPRLSWRRILRTFSCRTSGKEAIFFNNWPIGVQFTFSRICSASRSCSGLSSSAPSPRRRFGTLLRLFELCSGIIIPYIPIATPAAREFLFRCLCGRQQPQYLVCPANSFRRSKPTLQY